MAKAEATWTKTVEGVLKNINDVLSSYGLIEKDSSLLSNVKDRDYKQQMVAARSDLEQELIASGGSGMLLTKERKEVIAYKPTDLLQKLREGSISAVLVLQSYQAMAIEESKRTNCVTEFIPDAKRWAESLDAVKLGQMSDVTLPLHGLPVSVSDNISIEGLDCSLGLRKRLRQPADHDAVIVQVIKRLGAIPFVKTNTAQLCLSPGCSNPVWGETVHPIDPTRASGGASGGEAALIAGGGSMLGLGTDISGGLRTPAGWCGTVSLKPTAKRLSSKGCVSAIDPLGIHSTVGVMGRDSSIVVEAIKAILSADFHQYEAELAPLPWNDALYIGKAKKSLRIGFFDSIEILPSTLGVKRAVRDVVNLCKEQGHDVIHFSPPELEEGLDLFMALLMADQGHSVHPLLKGEIVDSGLAWYKQCAAVPPHLRHLAKPLIRRQFGDIVANHSLGSLYSIADLWKKLAERQEYCNRFLLAWKKEELDLLVCPVFPSPAALKEHCGKLTIACLPTLLFNLLDYPVATVPVCRQTQDDETNIDKYEATDYIHELLKESGAGAEGLPLSVQIVALPYSEELLCRAVGEITEHLNFKL
ncbi:vitamin D3 hydroxylase-associated protein [Hyalella azteca]|uniref:Vitamin D3 hydroxylase-associated protein n=1 Tax=Hyalella azteca TaxID=294128 RepID=A0A8B7NSV1_HYAAZ|nr:vitamin D3 hydroxylase-associated protein [Hyalella azteca]